MPAESSVRRNLGTDRGTFPTFLIVAAPHSGARALGGLLRRFPTIHLPAHESLFFEHRFDLGPRWYQALFRPSAETRVVGDLSSATLGHEIDQQLVAARIDGFLPGVRVIAVIRDPVERALAHYRELVLENKVEADRPIEDYVGTHGTTDAHGVLSCGFYGQNLVPFVRRFRDRLQLVDHGELWRDPAPAIVRVARHLGAPITEDPRVHPEDGDAANDYEVPTGTRRVLEPYFADDLETLNRATGFRFRTPLDSEEQPITE